MGNVALTKTGYNATCMKYLVYYHDHILPLLPTFCNRNHRFLNFDFQRNFEMSVHLNAGSARFEDLQDLDVEINFRLCQIY